MADEQRRGNGGKERLQKIKEARPKAIKVLAANEDVARLIKHPHGGKFKKDGSAMWPPDRFTQRRLNDGDITLEEKKEEKKPEARAEAKPYAS